MGEDLGYPAIKVKGNCVLDGMAVAAAWSESSYLFNFASREFGYDFSERSNLS